MLKLSIAVPSFNVAEWLEGTLDSVLACDSDEYEILVIDDGSTDETPQIAQRYQKEWPDKVRHVRKENGHYGSAVNRGIQEAKGLYFFVLDGDDCVKADGLAELLEAIDMKESPDLVLCNLREVYIDKGCSRIVRSGLEPGYYQVDAMEVVPIYSKHAAAYKTELLRDNNVKLTEGVHFTDKEYTLFPKPFVQTIKCCSAEVYQYRLGVEGQSVSPENERRAVGARRRVLDEACSWFDHVDFDGLVPAVCDSIVYHVLHFMGGNTTFAIKLGRQVAREEIEHIEELVEARPLLSQSRYREMVRFKGYGLVRASDYRLAYVRSLLGDAKAKLQGFSEDIVYDPRLS